MTLFALGINHTTATVDLREAVAFSPEQLQQALAEARTPAAKKWPYLHLQPHRVIRRTRRRRQRVAQLAGAVSPHRCQCPGRLPLFTPGYGRGPPYDASGQRPKFPGIRRAANIRPDEIRLRQRRGSQKHWQPIT